MQLLADSGQDVDLGNAFPAVLQVPPSVFVEIEKLHAKLYQLQAQDIELLALSERRAVGMPCATKKWCSRCEIGKPGCTTPLQQATRTSLRGFVK